MCSWLMMGRDSNQIAAAFQGDLIVGLDKEIVDQVKI